MSPRSTALFADRHARACAALAAGAALLATACGSTSPKPVAPAPLAAPPIAPAPASGARPAGADETAPTPYTAAQIRDASRAGRTYVYRIEAPGAAPRTTTITFLKVTPEEAETRSTTVDEKTGAAVQPEKESRATWDELRRHAEFPRAATTITDETITVPAGTFDCKVYAVVERKEANAPHMRFYFAKAMPGAPVLITIDKGGARVHTQTLLVHKPGA